MVSDITKKMRSQKIKQYTKLFELCNEIGDKEKAEYAIREVMEYKGKLTDEMKEILDDLPIKGARDNRKSGYNCKWVYGDYKPFLTCYVRGKDGVSSATINEITDPEKLKDIPGEIHSIDKRCERDETEVENDYFEKAMEGEYLTYEVRYNKENMGYVVVKGLPGKRGYLVEIIMDTVRSDNTRAITGSVANCVVSTLESMNTSYGVKKKIVQ